MAGWWSKAARHWHPSPEQSRADCPCLEDVNKNRRRKIYYYSVCVLLKIIKNLFIIINNNSGRTPCRTPGTNRVCMCNFFLFLIKEILLRASTARCPYPYTLLKKKFLQQKGQRTSSSSHREEETYRSPFLRFLRNQSINKNKKKKILFYISFRRKEKKKQTKLHHGSSGSLRL